MIDLYETIPPEKPPVPPELASFLHKAHRKIDAGHKPVFFAWECRPFELRKLSRKNLNNPVPKRAGYRPVYFFFTPLSIKYRDTYGQTSEKKEDEDLTEEELLNQDWFHLQHRIGLTLYFEDGSTARLSRAEADYETALSPHIEPLSRELGVPFRLWKTARETGVLRKPHPGPVTLETIFETESVKDVRFARQKRWLALVALIVFLGGFVQAWSYLNRLG